MIWPLLKQALKSFQFSFILDRGFHEVVEELRVWLDFIALLERP